MGSSIKLLVGSQDDVLGPGHRPFGHGPVVAVGEAHPVVGGDPGVVGLLREVFGEAGVVQRVFVGAAAPFADDGRDAQPVDDLCLQVAEELVDVGLLGGELVGVPVAVDLHGDVAGFLRQLELRERLEQVGVPRAGAAAAAVGANLNMHLRF